MSSSPRSTSSRLAPWQGQLLVGLLLVGCYPYLPAGTVEHAFYVAICLFGMAAVTVGVRWHRPAAPLPWRLLLAGMATYLVADVTYVLLSRAADLELPFPSIADVGYYLFYPVVAAAHVVTLRRRLPGRDRAGLVDALLITVAAAVLSWTFLMAPYASDTSLSLLEKVASLGYPVCDILLVALLARLVLAPGRRPPAYRLLVLAFASLLVTDAIYGYQVLAGTYVLGSVVDTGWFLMYVLWGAAALHPSMVELTERSEPARGLQSRRRLWLMAAAALTAPALLIVQFLRGATVDVVVLAGGCVVMFLLVLLRMSGLLDEVEERQAQLQRTLEDLEQSQAARRMLLDRTVQVAEQERVRLAADLHDGPIQRLAAVSLMADRALLRLDRGDVATAAELFERGHDELQREVDALRRMMSGLRPPVLDEAGLSVGIADLVDDFSRRTGVTASFSGAVTVELPDASETALYRIVQESLSNIAKHAEAGRVRVELAEWDDVVALTVRDDGRGFHRTPSAALLRAGHFGLVGMQERVEVAGGDFSVSSAPGAGTTVSAVLPVARVGTRPGLLGLSA